jgi:hypothetical protein
MLERYRAIILALNRLFGVDFTKDNLTGPLAKSVLMVQELYEKGHTDLCDIELIKLHILTTNLLAIEAYDPALLKVFLRGLKSGRIDDYIGTRCEIDTACTLILNKVPFTKTESPDFTITGTSTTFYIECSSVHLSTPKNADLRYKIESVIKKKAAEPYCNDYTALFIEFTNVQFHSQVTSVKLEPAALRAYFPAVVNKTNFGSVFLFTFIVDLDEPVSKGAWYWVRFDNTTANPEFLEFLNQTYPTNKKNINEFLYPYVN